FVNISRVETKVQDYGSFTIFFIVKELEEARTLLEKNSDRFNHEIPKSIRRYQRPQQASITRISLHMFARYSCTKSLFLCRAIALAFQSEPVHHHFPQNFLLSWTQNAIHNGAIAMNISIHINFMEC
ncbi:hypothetical protein ACJX0J_034027, partial [Zea mays]